MSVHSELRAPNSALLFDAVGTLVYADPAPAVVYEQYGRRHGSQLSLAEIAGRFREAFAAEEAKDRRDPAGRTSEAREMRRWQSIVRRTFVDLADTQTLLDELWHHFAQPSSWSAFDDAREMVIELTASDVVVGVASNFDARLPAIIAHHFPTIPSERVYVSSLLGHRKPAREFFEQCGTHLVRGMHESETSIAITLIGDDVENDLLGAQRAGLLAILVDRENRQTMHSPRIDDLRALRK